MVTQLSQLNTSHLVIAISSGDKLTEQEAEDLLAEIDISKDGVIDYKEFFKMLTGSSLSVD